MNKTHESSATLVRSHADLAGGFKTKKKKKKKIYIYIYIYIYGAGARVRARRGRWRVGAFAPPEGRRRVERGLRKEKERLTAVFWIHRWCL